MVDRDRGFFSRIFVGYFEMTVDEQRAAAMVIRSEATV
jgi:hypothetical protein